MSAAITTQSSKSIDAASLSEHEARELTEEVKADAIALWTKLLKLYEGQAHLALGYSSWAEYYAAEFGQTKSHGYRLLEAARVDRALSDSPNGERPVTESVARELTPVLKNEGSEKVEEVWDKVVDEHGPAPTAQQVRDVVKSPDTASAPKAATTSIYTADEVEQQVRDFLAEWDPGDFSTQVTAETAFTAFVFDTGLLQDGEAEIPDAIWDVAQPFLKALDTVNTYITIDISDSSAFRCAREALELLSPVLRCSYCVDVWETALRDRVAEAQGVAGLLDNLKPQGPGTAK